MKATFGKSKLFKKGEKLTVELYSDVEYVGPVVNRRFIASYYTFIASSISTCRSKKQSAIISSSAQAEFRAMAQEFVNFYGWILFWMILIMV